MKSVLLRVSAVVVKFLCPECHRAEEAVDRGMRREK